MHFIICMVKALEVCMEQNNKDVKAESALDMWLRGLGSDPITTNNYVSGFELQAVLKPPPIASPSSHELRV